MAELATREQLFGTGTVPATLQLVRSRTTSKGMVISTYRRGGPPKTGTFV